MWPFRKRRADSPPGAVPPLGEVPGARDVPGAGELPPVLEAITADTPRRFSITLADADATDRARAAFAERLAAELTITPRRDAVGQTVLDLDSTFVDGVAAVLRPLNQLHYGNVDVAGVDLNDLVTDVDDAALAQAVEDWAANGNIGPYRKRLEHLGGAELLQRCVARTSGADTRARSAWWLAVRLIVFNTQGAEGLAVAEAARSKDASAGRLLIDAAIERLNLVRLARMDADVPMEPLAELLHRSGYLAERACHLVWSLRAPVDSTIGVALRDLVPRGGSVATAAMTALHDAEPTTNLRATVDSALASDEAEVRASALALLARHWPNDARPVWREFLTSRSAPLRLTAESVLGRYGDEQDLEDAAAQLVKLSRGAGTDTSPPRGHEIVELLLRHRDLPVARAAFQRLASDWPRVRADLRSWLEAKHPELTPSSGAAAGLTAADDDRGEEEELLWPPPRIGLDGDEVTVVFDEAPSHSSARSRFEELVEREGFEVFESERDFLLLRTSSPDAEERLRRLWSEASADL